MYDVYVTGNGGVLYLRELNVQTFDQAKALAHAKLRDHPNQKLFVSIFAVKSSVTKEICHSESSN